MPYISKGNTIVKYVSEGEVDKVNLKIPSEIDGIIITEIGANVFQENSQIESVFIPKNIVKIGKFAFADSSVSKVKFEKSSMVVNIDSYAFANTKIKDIIIPNTITHIGERCFYGCKNLKTFLIENGSDLKVLDSFAFYNCLSLNEVLINSKCEEFAINYGCFQYCKNLYYVDLENTKIKVIGSKAFSNCSSLQKFKFPNSLKVIGLNAFYSSGLINVDLSHTKLEEMGIGAFSRLLSLKSLKLPKFLLKYRGDEFLKSSITDQDIKNIIKEQCPFCEIGDKYETK